MDILHPKEHKLKKEEIREFIRTKFKKQHVSVFGVKRAYGGSRTQGFVLIYDNEDSFKKIEPPTRLKRFAREKLSPNDRKKATKAKKEGRKVKKVKKHQGLKKRGTKRREEKNLERKQRKAKKS